MAAEHLPPAENAGARQDGSRGGDPSQRLWLRAGAGILLGAVLFAGLLVLAGAPPFDQVSPVHAVDQRPITFSGAEGKYGIPVNNAEGGEEIDWLFYVISGITGVIFVVVELLLVYFLFKYRKTPGRRAVHIHGNHKLEFAWTITPAVILFLLVLLSRSTWAKIRYGEPPADPAVKIEVTAQQFEWTFSVVGTAEVFGKARDLFSRKILHVPLVKRPDGTTKPISMELKSKDVLHSFYLPNFRRKLDAVPGMTGHLWFTPLRTGSFEVVCAELCGAEHWNMRGELHVDSPEDYAKWLESIKQYTPDKPK